MNKCKRQLKNQYVHGNFFKESNEKVNFYSIDKQNSISADQSEIDLLIFFKEACFSAKELDDEFLIIAKNAFFTVNLLAAQLWRFFGRSQFTFTIRVSQIGGQKM